MFNSFSSKKFIVLGIILTMALFVLAGCGGQSKDSSNDGGNAKEETKPIELTLSHVWPSTHEMETKIVKEWIQAVEEATDGKVKITSFPAGTLIPSGETYDGITKGVADIGLSAYSYTRGRFPVVETFLVPGIEYNNSVAATEALMEGIEKLDPEELKDTKHLFSFATGPGDLFSKKPIRSLADLKGMQIGVSAGLRADAVGLLGATPIVMPMPEWYEALSKNIMQGGIGPLETLQGYRLGEVTGDYITLTPFFYNQVFFAVMNNEKWNSLPPDVQQAITEVNQKYYKEKVAPWFNRITGEGFKWVNEKKKVEVITLSDEEKALWLEKIKPLEEQYVKTLNEKGLPGADILKTVKEIVDKNNAQYPEKAPYVK